MSDGQAEYYRHAGGRELADVLRCDQCDNGLEAEWIRCPFCEGLPTAEETTRTQRLQHELDHYKAVWKVCVKVLADKDDELASLRTRIAELEAGLTPFAAVGEAIEHFFGAAMFHDDETAFKSEGCTWRENGEQRRLTWGNFRRAHALLEERADPCAGGSEGSGG